MEPDLVYVSSVQVAWYVYASYAVAALVVLAITLASWLKYRIHKAKLDETRS